MNSSGKFVASEWLVLCNCQVSSMPFCPRSAAERVRVAALELAVVEDRDARRHGRDHGGNRAVLVSVMRHEVQIDVADEIGRTRERGQVLPGQIAEIEERELPNFMRIPRDRGFSVCGSASLPSLAQAGLACPRPRSLTVAW